ncbi:MAG: cell wall-binding repeat-containing protein [Actinomycetia bacterium]|nr:cell wall-binding repeat-containing protein [Actinomycetes bacterium]
MHGRTRRTFALVVAVALVSAMMLPGLAFAKTSGVLAPTGIKPLAVYPKDAYESDNTSATAKVLPEVSIHTFDNGTDEDWFKVSTDTTGTPFVFETQYISNPAAIWDTDMTVYEVDAADPTGLRQLWYQDDSNVWEAYGSTAFFKAPAPGTYYVKVQPLGEDDRGYYTTFVYEGIGRRVAGANRFATAVALSKTMYPDSPNGAWGSDAAANGVILTNGTAFADALTAGAWGAMRPDVGDDEIYPLLLTTTDTLPAVTEAEIERLAGTQWWASEAFTVYVVGGPSVVSDAQLQMIKELPYVADAVRVSGTNRYATAAAVASMTLDITTPSTAVLANGLGWADGVSAGPLCGSMQAPMLLSQVDTMPAETSQWLLDHPSVTDVVIVGSGSVVSTGVADALAAAPYNMTVTRLAGADRYATAYEIAAYGTEGGWFDASGMTLVSGLDFPDGLAAGPFSMLTGSGFGPGPILLTKKAELSDAAIDYFVNWSDVSRPSYVIGGEGAISDQAFREFLGLYDMQS